MKFIGIKKVHEGRFISAYNAEYETEAGNKKIYEMVSRDKNITSIEDLKREKCDAVVLIITSPDGEKIILITAPMNPVATPPAPWRTVLMS